MVSYWNKITIFSIIIILSLNACAPNNVLPSSETGQSGIYILDLDAVQATLRDQEGSSESPIVLIQAATATFEPLATSTATIEPTIPAPTNAPDQESPTPTEGQLTPTAPAENAAPACVNRAEFIKHLSISDNTALQPGAYFGKVWLIKNIGTCTWTTSYQFVFASGDLMQGLQSFPISYEVKPGETLEVRVTLVAPLEEKTYIGEWMLQDEFGSLFGIGDLGTDPLHVQIVVRAPTKFDGL